MANQANDAGDVPIQRALRQKNHRCFWTFQLSSCNLDSFVEWAIVPHVWRQSQRSREVVVSGTWGHRGQELWCEMLQTERVSSRVHRNICLGQKLQNKVSDIKWRRRSLYCLNARKPRFHRGLRVHFWRTKNFTSRSTVSVCQPLNRGCMTY